MLRSAAHVQTPVAAPDLRGAVDAQRVHDHPEFVAATLPGRVRQRHWTGLGPVTGRDLLGGLAQRHARDRPPGWGRLMILPRAREIEHPPRVDLVVPYDTRIAHHGTVILVWRTTREHTA